MTNCMLYVWTNSTQKYVSLLPYNASCIGEFLCSVVLRFLHWLTYIIWKKFKTFILKLIFFDNLCIQNKSLLRHYTRTISSFFDYSPKYMDFSKLSNNVVHQKDMVFFTIRVVSNMKTGRGTEDRRFSVVTIKI